MIYVDFFGHKVSKLIIGDNPYNGHSYITKHIPGEEMKNYYTEDKILEEIYKMEELGINTIYTHFYKGSGLVFEKEEMNRTKELTKIAHKYGISVLGYMSMGSIYTENITREIPDVKDMLVIDHNGKYHPTLYDQYYRPRPC